VCIARSERQKKGCTMEEILNFLKGDMFIIITVIINIFLICLCAVNALKLSKTKKEYTKFMKKIGNGSNIDQMLKEYIEKVDSVSKENKKILEHLQKIENEKMKCIQKIGIVRYSAFKDVGSDLSFALALLDDNNNGVVLNGIYSADSSNIYAKPIINGESKYTITKEEKQAIEQALVR